MKKRIGDYILDEKIGAGAFGEVYRSTNLKTKGTYAIKMLNKSKMQQKILSYLEREIEIIQKVDSEYIVKLLDLRASENNYYLIFEYCNGGDLTVYKKAKGGKVSETIGRRIIRQVVSALNSLYAMNGIHRDIKLSNILLHYPNEASKEKDEPTSKLCDFGFARFIEEDKADTEVPIEMSIVGTPLNMSPEMFQRKPYTIKSDLWSLGATVYELLCGKPSFFGINKEQLGKAIELGDYNIPKECGLSAEAIDFITACLQNEPKNRLAWKQLTTHPFICTSNTTPFDFAKLKANNEGYLNETKESYRLSSKTRYNFAPLYEKPKGASAAAVKAEKMKKEDEEIIAKIQNVEIKADEPIAVLTSKHSAEAEAKVEVEAEAEVKSSLSSSSSSSSLSENEETPDAQKPGSTEAESKEGLVFEEVAKDCVKVDEGNDIDDKLKSEYVML